MATDARETAEDDIPVERHPSKSGVFAEVIIPFVKTFFAQVKLFLV